MEQSPFWEADSHSASPEIPLLLWNSKVQYHVWKGMLLVTILKARWTQSTPFHPISLRCILVWSSHLCLGHLSGLFPSDLLTRLCMHFSPLPCVLLVLPVSSSSRNILQYVFLCLLSISIVWNACYIWVSTLSVSSTLSLSSTVVHKSTLHIFCWWSDFILSCLWQFSVSDKPLEA